MESNTKVSYIKVKVEDIGYEDFKLKEKPVFEVTEEGQKRRSMSKNRSGSWRRPNREQRL